MERIARRRTGSYLLTATAYDAAGDPAEISAPVAVRILDGIEAEVPDADGTPIVVDGVMRHSIPASALPLLDTYTAVWTGTIDGQAEEWTTAFELVGGHLFEISELRGRARELEDELRYPTPRLADERTAAEERLETACSRAFVPRGRRVVFRSRPDRILLPDMLVREVHSLTIDSHVLSDTEIAALDIDHHTGVIRRPHHCHDPLDGHHRGHHRHEVSVSAHYSYGGDYPPEPVRKAALALAQESTLPSAIPARATVMTTEVGSYRISVAGADGRTGLPEVDAVIAQFGLTRPAVG